MVLASRIITCMACSTRSTLVVDASAATLVHHRAAAMRLIGDKHSRPCTCKSSPVVSRVHACVGSRQPSWSAWAGKESFRWLGRITGGHAVYSVWQTCFDAERHVHCESGRSASTRLSTVSTLGGSGRDGSVMSACACALYTPLRCTVARVQHISAEFI